jgi:GntR family transcriptional regulator
VNARRLPRYHRIAESLRERIRGGEWSPGAPLPNQRRLARDFGVTLMTLRQALELLERDHLITRRHGLGTFVAAPTIDYEILKLRRFAGDLSAQGEAVSTRVLSARPAVTDRRASAALGLAPRARLVVIERLRLVEEHPMSLQRSFLPAGIGEQVLTSDLAETPLSQVLEFKLGIVIVRAREAVSAVRLGPREAHELACPAGAPAFESERVSFDAAGRPVVFDRVFIPGDRFRITRELHYDSVPSEPEDVRGATTS